MADESNEVFDGMTCRCGFQTMDEDEANNHKCSDVTTDEQIIEKLCPVLGQMLEDGIVSMGRLEEVRTAFLDLWREKEEAYKNRL
jgi:hypothetical protein